MDDDVFQYFWQMRSQPSAPFARRAKISRRRLGRLFFRIFLQQVFHYRLKRLFFQFVCFVWQLRFFRHTSIFAFAVLFWRSVLPASGQQRGVFFLQPGYFLLRQMCGTLAVCWLMASFQLF